MQTWATWKPKSFDELIGDGIRTQAELIRYALGQPEGERCFLIHGYEGRGKTTIADMLAREWIDDPLNYQVVKGAKVTMATTNEWEEQSATTFMFGSRRAILVNECDRIHKDVQDSLHDWLQDEMPKSYAFFVTTNKKPCHRDQYEKMSASEKAEHLTPKFASRFTWYEAPKIPTNELAMELAKMCLKGVQMKKGLDQQENAQLKLKAAKICVENGGGDIRASLKHFDKLLSTIQIKNRKRSEEYATL